MHAAGHPSDTAWNSPQHCQQKRQVDAGTHTQHSNKGTPWGQRGAEQLTVPVARQNPVSIHSLCSAFVGENRVIFVLLLQNQIDY